MDYLEFKNLKNINNVQDLVLYLNSISIDEANELTDFYLNLQVESYELPSVESFLCSLKNEYELVLGHVCVKDEIVDRFEEEEDVGCLYVSLEDEPLYSPDQFYTLLSELQIRGDLNIYFDGSNELFMSMYVSRDNELNKTIQSIFVDIHKKTEEQNNRVHLANKNKFKRNLLIWMLDKFNWEMAWSSSSEDSYQRINLNRIRNEIEQDRKQIDDIWENIKASQKETHNDRIAIEDIKKTIDNSEENIEKVKLELDNINKNIVTIMALLSTVFSIIGLNLYSMNASMTYVGIIILNVSLVFCLSFLFLLLDVLVYKSDDKRKIIL